MKRFERPFNFYSKQSKSTIPDLQAPDGEWAKDDKEKAETLNKYFGSVFTVEDIQSLPLLEKKCKNLLTIISSTAEEISEMLKHLDITG